VSTLDGEEEDVIDRKEREREERARALRAEREASLTHGFPESSSSSQPSS